MSYLVMECHPAYVVVLDEEGRFLKAANMNYQTGQHLTEIIELRQPNMEVPQRHTTRRRAAIASIAACLCLVLVTSWTLVFAAYGTVRLQINPDVELTVNRFDYVIRAQGLNEDGSTLLEGWSCFFKKIDTAAGQLTRKAGEDGFLQDDGTVHVTVTSRNSHWRSDLEQELVVTLQDHTAATVKIMPLSPEETAETDDPHPSDCRDPENQDDMDEPEEENDEDEPEEDDDADEPEDSHDIENENAASDESDEDDKDMDDEDEPEEDDDTDDSDDSEDRESDREINPES